jgi:hypothetical protein
MLEHRLPASLSPSVKRVPLCLVAPERPIDERRTTRSWTMSASLVYGLAVRVDGLFAAVAMHRLLAKPSLALKMLINRRIAGTLASGGPSQVSLASLPVEILSRIL